MISLGIIYLHRQAVICFCTLKSEGNDDIAKALLGQVRTQIGPFATPKRVVIVPDLPKTRSGKIMRRILRKIASQEIQLKDAHDAEAIFRILGDTSTLADQTIVAIIIECFAAV